VSIRLSVLLLYGRLSKGLELFVSPECTGMSFHYTIYLF